MKEIITQFDSLLRGFQGIKRKSCLNSKINGPHLAFLYYINEGENVTASELAKYFMMTIGGAMHILDYLTADGYLEKIILEDKRKKSYKITEKGKNIIDEVNEKHNSFKVKLLEYLGEKDTIELMRILARAKKFIEEY